MKASWLTALLVATPAVAHADDRDYGEQIAIADAASLVMMKEASVPTGIVSWMLLSPALHLVHRQPDRAAASLGLRLVPLAALASIARCDGGEAELGCVLGSLFLAVGSALAATTIDVFVIADGDAEEAPVMLGGGGRF